MRFVKDSADAGRIKDTVFAVAAAAKAAKARDGDRVIDATLGSLYDEEGKLVAFKSVYDSFDRLDPRIKAAYAPKFAGSDEFRRAAKDWILGGRDLGLASAVIATPGGTGADFITIESCANPGDTLLLPEIAWGSYELMARQYGLKTAGYPLFSAGHFDLEGFRGQAEAIAKRQGRLLAVVNDPCHNPTGYSLTAAEWRSLIAILNRCAEHGPVILLNDIAYIDYSYDLAHSRDYMESFRDLGPNTAVVVAFSTSKTLTSYGLRLGAALILAKDAAKVGEMEAVYEKYARATWSNVINAGQVNFVKVVEENRAAFLAEKAVYIELLRQRSERFLREADACGLACYPYKEGFFITLPVAEEKKERIHAALIQEDIFTVMVPKGIRIAICSLNLRQIPGLARRLKDILGRS